jgi:hypothetical protein
MPRGICLRRYAVYPFALLPTPLTCFFGVLSWSGYMMMCPSSDSGGHSSGEAETAGPQLAVVGYQTRFEAIPGSFVQTAEDVGSCTTRAPVQRGRYCFSASIISLRNGWVERFCLCVCVCVKNYVRGFFPPKTAYFWAILFFMLKMMYILVTVGWVPRRIRICE